MYTQLTYRLRVIGKLFGQLYKELRGVQTADDPQCGTLGRDQELVRNDGDRGHGVQLLEELEAVGVLELEVNAMADQFQEGMEDAPRLALEDHWDELGWKSQGVRIHHKWS